MIFTGVTGFLLALFYCVVHCAEGLKRPCQGLVETVINALWVIFWLSAAASFAAEPQCKTDQLVFAFDSCSTFFAAAAFAWMSWILWMVSTALSIIDMRSGSGMPMGGCARRDARGEGKGGMRNAQSIVLVALPLPSHAVPESIH